MPSQDRSVDDAHPARSLSEQLRELEAHLVSVNEISLPPAGRRTRLPTSLGRPLGLSQPDGFPRILTAGPDGRTLEDDLPPAPPSALRRSIAVAGAGLLLLTATAILPSLIWPHVEPTAPTVVEETEVSARTGSFATAARELALAPPAPVTAPAQLPSRAVPPPLAEPAIPTGGTPQAAPEPATAIDARAPQPSTTLEVAESELSRLTVPRIVAGVAPTATGSAVVIDGLPADARVSPGIRIAPDAWAVGIRDVDYAVLSLPRDTPERLDLMVRVVAADSHELAANRLHIRVRRTANAAEAARAAAASPVAAPTAHFEPAAAVGEPGLEAVVALPLRKPAVVMKRTPAPSPAWPTEVSAWTQAQPTAAPLPPVEKAPAWAPFGSP